MSPPNPSALEDLVVENRRTYSDALNAVRAVPRDGAATMRLLEDDARMDRLAELAQVERGRILDVAVRGVNVSFMVADELDGNGQPTGAVSSGYFPVADLDAGTKASAARKRGHVEPSSTQVGTPARPGSATGGTATVPTVARDGEHQQPPGVPGDISELNAKNTIKLLKEPPQGVDPRAVALFERDGREDPRDSVIKEAEKLGLFEPRGDAGAIGSAAGVPAASATGQAESDAQREGSAEPHAGPGKPADT